MSGSPTTGYLRFGHAISYSATIGLRDLNTFVDPTLGLTLITANARPTTSASWAARKRQGRSSLIASTPNTGEIDLLSGGWQGDVVAYGVNSVGDTVGFGFVDAANTQQAALPLYRPARLQEPQRYDRPHQRVDARGSHRNQRLRRHRVVGWGFHNGQVSAFHLRVSPETVAGAEANTCHGNSEGSLYLWSDGVVGPGERHLRRGVQGSTTAASQTGITPTTTNQEMINGSVVVSCPPNPPRCCRPEATPAPLPSNVPTGADGQLDGKWANRHGVGGARIARLAAPTPVGNSGTEVNVEGTEVAITPDTSQYGATPQRQPVGPPPQLGNQYFGTLKGTLGVSPSGAATYTVPISTPPGVARNGTKPEPSSPTTARLATGSPAREWLARRPVGHQSLRQDRRHGRPTSSHPNERRRRRVPRRKAPLQHVKGSTTAYQAEAEDFSAITAYNNQSTFKITTKTGEVRYYGLPHGIPRHPSHVRE